MDSLQEKYEAAVISLSQRFRDEINLQAPLLDTVPATLTKAVINQLLGEEDLKDGRARSWRVRLRLYDARSPNDPEADSDLERHPDLPGATVISGLPAVLEWISELACHYHKAACPGLDRPTLERKGRSLRTMMSNRKNGSGFLCADYEVLIAPGRVKHMLARCDVVQIGSPSDISQVTYRRKLPGS